ncbi:HlyD family type I secretion periplasmic adaptor subunit [soil metagenome]
MIDTDQSLRRYQIIGYLGILVAVGGVTSWSAFASIHGAVIAPSVMMVESYSKKIQHKEGGIIKEIKVADGDVVEQGQELIILDDTETRSELGIIDAMMIELLTKRARLDAERDDVDVMLIPEEVLARKDEPDVARVLSGQQKLFETRRAGVKGKKQQLQEQIGQLNEQIRGLIAQQESTVKQIDFINDELKGLRDLQKKGLVPLTRVLAMEREGARLEGQRGELVATKARAEGQIGEIKIQIIQVDEESRTQTLTEMRDVESRLSELQERRLASREKLSRTSIRSPIKGDVYQLSVHTIGGVIAPGEGLMLIVPEADELVLQAQVSPHDVDQVHAGQKANVRFPALNARRTPEISAEVIQVSADVSRVDASSPPFYGVRLRIPPGELAKLGDQKLKPGMPAEAFIQTTERSPLSYFLKPLIDQVAHTFREP